MVSLVLYVRMHVVLLLDPASHGVRSADIDWMTVQRCLDI